MKTLLKAVIIATLTILLLSTCNVSITATTTTNGVTTEIINTKAYFPNIHNVFNQYDPNTGYDISSK